MSKQKRKHYTLSIKDKNTIIERLEKGEHVNKLAKEYGIGRTTIYDINKNRAKIQTFVSTTYNVPGNRHTLKKAKYPELEETLYKWFMEERKHAPISGPQLAAKAKFFYKQLTKKNDFSASKGWLDRFKTRYGIRLSMLGEVLTDASCVKEFKKEFSQKVKNLDLCLSQVYSVAETALHWRVLSKNTFISCEETICKEKVTFLSCANVSGLHKLPLLVTGNSKNPSSFKNIDLPVHYYWQKSSSMTTELFRKWFNEIFVPEVRTWLKAHNLSQKAIILVDKSLGHPCEEDLISDDKTISIMILPSNTSLKLMELANQSVKQHYKNNILLTAASRDQSVEKTLREFSMKDMAFSLAQSWRLLPASTISSSWKDLWPNIEEITTPQEATTFHIPCGLEVLEKISNATQIGVEKLQEWCDGDTPLDDEDSEFRELPEDRIGQETGPIKEELDDDELPTASCVPSEVVNSFDVCLKWAEENGCSSADILVLRKLRDQALLSQSVSMKQESIDSYFEPTETKFI